MAVEDRFLGQQVRCPHCQQVLIAPNPSNAPVSDSNSPDRLEAELNPSLDFSDGQEHLPSDISSVGPLVHEHESIFAPSSEGNEDLFGIPSSSMVEFPSETAGNAPIQEKSDEKPSSDSSPPISSNPITSPYSEAFSTESLEQPNLPPLASPGTVEVSAVPSSDDEWPKADGLLPPADLPEEMKAKPDYTRQVARRAKRESLFTTYLIIILIPYAIFASCVAVYFYWRMMQMPHPLEYLRDAGENPPAKRSSSSVQEVISPETGLPSKLQVALGQSIRIGDLEVQPQKVERRKITICSESGRLPQLTATDALVLTLRLRNISPDVFFTPTDPVFDRRWKGELGTNRPYTLLDIGGVRFFGGPVKWSPRTKDGKSRGIGDPREYVKGQEHDNQILKPGEERTSIFCTDPDNPEILRALKGYQGPLVWRVHLRRGLVPVGDREVSATAVIGVVFDKKDILSGS
jgi:hypothetical protein